MIAAVYDILIGRHNLSTPQRQIKDTLDQQISKSAVFGGAATQPCVQQQPHHLSSSAAQSQRKIRVIGHGTMDHRKRTMDRTTAGPPLNKGANDAATAATSPNQRVGWPGDAKSRQQLFDKSKQSSSSRKGGLAWVLKHRSLNHLGVEVPSFLRSIVSDKQSCLLLPRKLQKDWDLPYI